MLIHGLLEDSLDWKLSFPHPHLRIFNASTGTHFVS